MFIFREGVFRRFVQVPGPLLGRRFRPYPVCPVGLAGYCHCVTILCATSYNTTSPLCNPLRANLRRSRLLGSLGAYGSLRKPRASTCLDHAKLGKTCGAGGPVKNLFFSLRFRCKGSKNLGTISFCSAAGTNGRRCSAHLGSLCGHVLGKLAKLCNPPVGLPS